MSDALSRQGVRPEPASPQAADYLPLVQRLARRLARRLPAHVALDDLVSAGVIGLMECLPRFDPSRGRDVGTYVTHRVRGAMLDELRRQDSMGRDARLQMKRIETAVLQLTQSLGQPPSDAELAQALALEVEDLHARMGKLVAVHLVAFDDGRLSCPAGADPSDLAAQREQLAQLAQALEALTRRQQQVLHLYYQEDLTLREMGHVLGVSESRACQLLAAATPAAARADAAAPQPEGSRA